MAISVEHLKKAYGSQLALNDVTFTVNSGEIAGLIGPNGAGKSTLMKIICTLLLPLSGEVKINNVPVTVRSNDIKRHLGYLPENNPLYGDLYVKEYLHYVAGLYNMGKKINARVSEVIGMTGLGPEMNKKIGVLSKGYRQRVGLAQAIIHDPDILILDEPTTGLDPNQIVEIRNLISDLGKEKTVILSTHIMQEVEAICNRVIIINKGKLIADDLTGNIGAYSISESQTILVEFGEDVSEEIFQDLIGISLVKKFKAGAWLIETSGHGDIRGDLFRLAVSKNLTILSLQLKDKKLEDVFRELTS